MVNTTPGAIAAWPSWPAHAFRKSQSSTCTGSLEWMLTQWLEPARANCQAPFDESHSAYRYLRGFVQEIAATLPRR
jgi:hypothetical protein